MKHIISLGAGVQSSTMALMAAHGEITPMPDAAIFADTQAEPNEVYRWLEWLTAQLPFPVYTVTAGNLTEAMLNSDYNPVPTFQPGGKMGRRQCTREYKIAPVEKKAREICGLEPGLRTRERVATIWKGISTDEIRRMDEPRNKWANFRFPLVEVNMSRMDCLEWVQRNYDRTPPRSACLYCPYHSNKEWLEIMGSPEGSWVAGIDTALNKRGEYLHPDRVPLETIDFGRAKDQINWVDECEGMCGL